MTQPPNRDDPSQPSGRPTIILDEDQLGPMGYQAWLHHAMWCPTRLAAITDPLDYFQSLDQQMEARLELELTDLPAGSNAHWQARLHAERRILREMGMPPAEVDRPVWTPDDEIEPPEHPLADMDEAMELLDEAMTALREDRDPTPALNRLDQLRRPADNDRG
jgi:hypothetical protein